MKEFSSLMSDTRSREVLEEARQSRSRSTEGIEGWKATEREDRLDVQGRNAIDSTEGEGLDDQMPKLFENRDADDIQATVQRFQDKHPELTTSLEEEPIIVKVCFNIDY